MLEICRAPRGRLGDALRRSTHFASATRPSTPSTVARDRGKRRWASWLVCIGLGAASAPAQIPPAGANGAFGWLSARDDRFRGRFQDLLLSVPTRDLNAGWQLAVDLGRPAVPLLWEMLQAEKSELGRRLAVLAAAVLAGGPGEDDRLLLWLDQQKPMLQERVLAAMLVALGPRRARPAPDFWARFLGPTKTPEQILGIAVRLAAARFPGTDAGAPVLVDDEPGLAAAAAFAGLPIAATAAARLWELKNPPRHAELFWRGALLRGARQFLDGTPVQDRLVETAREIGGLAGEPFAPARAAAALLRSRAHDVRPEGPRPEWYLLQLYASDAAAATALRPWLSPVPPPRDEEPQRLAVEYVLSRDVAAVVADRAAWSADARIRAHVALALAWRLLGEESPAPIDLSLPAVPEWFFVRWASGAQVAREAACEDPVLESLAALAAAQRVARPVARAALEDALWRWGSHPGLGMHENERLLVRDLLLIGSHPGGNKYVPWLRVEQRYRPTGIGPDHVFFEVAVALYDFLARPRLPIPVDCRLR